MKRTLLALGAVLGLSGAAAAADITYFGTAEYRTDAKVFQLEAGADVPVYGFTVTPEVAFNDAGGNFAFTKAKLTAAYDLNENFTAFVRLEADSDFKRQETTLGVALEF
jgi:predicted porin